VATASADVLLGAFAALRSCSRRRLMACSRTRSHSAAVRIGLGSRSAPRRARRHDGCRSCLVWQRPVWNGVLRVGRDASDERRPLRRAADDLPTFAASCCCRHRGARRLLVPPRAAIAVDPMIVLREQ